MNWLDIEVAYTDYCMECEEKGIKPLNKKTWWDTLE